MGRLAEKSTASIEALLAVARRSFGERGYADVSLEAIAAEARMTKGAVYHHFGSKLALFEAVYRVEHRRMIEMVTRKARPAADPLDALTRGVNSYLEALLDPVARRILLVDGPTVLGWERWRRCEEPGFQQMLEASLTAAAARGMLRAGLRPTESALLLLGATTEAALTVAHSQDPQAASKSVAAEITRHVDALRA